ncbi:MAG: hypothetical protein ACOC87_03430 [Candidatus Natronoplasma sp.]
MKIFFDTNIIISAYYFKGNERKALRRTIHSNHVPVISSEERAVEKSKQLQEQGVPQKLCTPCSI